MMSVRSLPLAVVVAEECESGVRIDVGCCYNCDALVPDGHRFCDTDCRDDWQRRHEVRR